MGKTEEKALTMKTEEAVMAVWRRRWDQDHVGKTQKTSKISSHEVRAIPPGQETRKSEGRAGRVRPVAE